MGGTVSDQLTFQWVQGSIVKERKTFAGCCFWEKMDQKSKGNEKPGSNTKIPCVFNRSVFAPHAASKTLYVVSSLFHVYQT